MKIKQIDITEYQQFKNITFNFTYPDDFHDEAKRGKPLDKVCFIGQSGTGKTTLLELIEKFLKKIGQIEHLKKIPDEFYETGYDQKDVRFKAVLGHIEIEEKKDCINVNTPKIEYSLNGNLESIHSFLKNYRRISIYQPAELISQKYNILSRRTEPFELLNQPKIKIESLELQQKLQMYSEDLEEKLQAIRKEKNIQLLNDSSQEIWELILEEIILFDLKLAQKGISLVKRGAFLYFDRYQEEMDNWLYQNPNPRQELGEKLLDKVLNYFKLEIDYKVARYFLAFKHTHSKQEIPGNGLSTGTKQVIFSALPIYKLAAPETIILFDEPERSLFPNLQRIIIDYYISLSPESQFFFATHSPIIAAAFEPCERFILYFDETGNIQYRRGTAPIGDDPNDILKQDFMMQSLMLDIGIEMHRKFLLLKTKIRNEKDPDLKKALAVEMLELGTKYNF